MNGNLPSNISTLWEKAGEIRGVLSYLKTEKGRRRYKQDDDEDPLLVENLFVSDEAKLLSSKAFRTLRDKTQVFKFPKTPLIRSRQAHVFEVQACGVVTSELLGLNTNLVRAIALGHDIGHGPLGHPGEEWLAKKMNEPDFCHEYMAAIVTQKIERRGKGLNLCHETLEGMIRHSGNKAKDGMSQEAWVVRYADKMAYLFADVNDIIGRMRFEVSPEIISLVSEFGNDQRERTSTVQSALVVESAEMGKVSFEKSEWAIKFNRLRTLMYEVYRKVSEQNVDLVLSTVFEFLEKLQIGDPFLLLALMTDKDVELIANSEIKDMNTFNQTSVSEIIPYLSEIGKVNLCDPDLNW